MLRTEKRHLVKMMSITLPDGYVLGIIGSHAETKIDSTIAQHTIQVNEQLQRTLRFLRTYFSTFNFKLHYRVENNFSIERAIFQRILMKNTCSRKEIVSVQISFWQKIQGFARNQKKFTRVF